MFEVCSLGHQGWLVRTQGTSVLVDPFLTRDFSRMVRCEMTCHPPREVQFGALPPIDAVFISHEHPDHLDFVSLQHLSRQIPIFLSAHSSVAAEGALTSLGFEVRLLEPGR